VRVCGVTVCARHYLHACHSVCVSLWLLEGSHGVVMRVSTVTM
jgi:hypothetical protein